MVKKTFYESDGRVREVGFRVFRGRESSAWAITWIWCMQYLLVLFWWVFTNKLCYLLIRVSIIDTSILQWFFVNSGGEFSVPELFLRVFFIFYHIPDVFSGISDNLFVFQTKHFTVQTIFEVSSWPFYCCCFLLECVWHYLINYNLWFNCSLSKITLGALMSVCVCVNRQNINSLQGIYYCIIITFDWN